MRLNLKILIKVLILFHLFEMLEIKAHNTFNGNCNQNCSRIINKRSKERKIKVFRKEEILIKEKNSCVNNSICRG